MQRRRSKTGIYDTLVRMMRRATVASPVTKQEIADAVHRKFPEHTPTQIGRSVQQVAWYQRKKSRKTRNSTIERLLKGLRVVTKPSKPRGFFITAEINSRPENGKETKSSNWKDAAVKQDKEQRKHVQAEIVQRSQMLAALIKAKRGYREVCEFKFDDMYGDLGTEFLEARHLLPVARKKLVKWDSSADSRAGLCANCHRMLHRLLWQRKIKNETEGRARVKELRMIVLRNRKAVKLSK